MRYQMRTLVYSNIKHKVYWMRMHTVDNESNRTCANECEKCWVCWNEWAGGKIKSQDVRRGVVRVIQQKKNRRYWISRLEFNFINVKNATVPFLCAMDICVCVCICVDSMLLYFPKVSFYHPLSLFTSFWLRPSSAVYCTVSRNFHVERESEELLLTLANDCYDVNSVIVTFSNLILVAHRGVKCYGQLN